jgi:hypothetical protein
MCFDIERDIIMETHSELLYCCCQFGLTFASTSIYQEFRFDFVLCYDLECGSSLKLALI